MNFSHLSFIVIVLFASGLTEVMAQERQLTYSRQTFEQPTLSQPLNTSVSRDGDTTIQTQPKVQIGGRLPARESPEPEEERAAPPLHMLPIDGR